MDLSIIDNVQRQAEYIELCKKTHSYSPAVVRLLELSKSYIPYVEEEFKKGRQAIWCFTYDWETLFLYSLGVLPAGYTEMGRYSDGEDMRLAENYYQFPIETCSMVKCVIAQWHLRLGTGSINRILGSSSRCDPYNLAWETLKKSGYDIYNCETLYRSPTTEGERLETLIQFFAQQLREIAFWVNGKRDIDEDLIKTEIARKNRLLQKTKRMLDLRLERPFYVRSLPIVLIVTSGLNNYFGRPEEYEEALDDLIMELESSPIDQDEIDRAVPIVWAGVIGQEFGVYEVLDQTNGAVLGLRSAPFRYYREDIPPLESIARWVYDNSGTGAAIHARRVIEAEVERIKAKGLIWYGYIGCPFSSVDRELWRHYFHEKGIPSINLEGSFQTGAPTGQVITRIQAFVEMLDQKKWESELAIGS
ncbi:MAG: 2-hydroxyacyl-CoA dehydratase family protein [Deltaproteobacteria bacterium]|nr:2-hydroxyacyl-CoA dehydratase family protein [Deltaproteobacteria bacterium]